MQGHSFALMPGKAVIQVTAQQSGQVLAVRRFELCRLSNLPGFALQGPLLIATTLPAIAQKQWIRAFAGGQFQSYFAHSRYFINTSDDRAGRCLHRKY